MEISIPEERVRFRRADEDWPAIYPYQFVLHGGVYADRTNGLYTAQDELYNDRPVYRSATTYYKVYYRVSGGAANKWVLDFNDVSEEWSGTVAIQSTLFAPEV